MPGPTIAEIENLLQAKEDAERASTKAESVKCTATVITGDDYKINFSDYSGEG